jgi:hypothetical protein
MTSHRRKNKDSFIRATIQEHRAVLGLVNPAEKVSDMKKRWRKMLSPHAALFRVF